MSKKRLFSDETEKFSDEGLKLLRQTHNVLRPIFEEWSAGDYSVRDISMCIQSEAAMLESEMIVKKAMAVFKAKKEK
jgi:hypothetical protein